MNDNEMIKGLVEFFKLDPSGNRVLEGKLDEIIFDLGHDRGFFQRAGLDYSNPPFRAIQQAIVIYRNELKGGEYKE